MPAHLASDRYHGKIAEHHAEGSGDATVDDPTIRISRRELTCGDEASFAVSVSPEGVVEGIAVDAESCAVSRAVSDILRSHFRGRSVEEIAAGEPVIPELLAGQFPDLRRDCVLGPEEALRAGVADYLDRQDRVGASDDA
nr:iron-sulfur cluster assembly scaffold protein [Halostella litorea]